MQGPGVVADAELALAPTKDAAASVRVPAVGPVAQGQHGGRRRRVRGLQGWHDQHGSCPALSTSRVRRSVSTGR